MSLKVYKGIKFKTRDLGELVSQLHALKKKALENSSARAVKHPDKFVYNIVEKTEDAFKFDVNDFKTVFDAGQKIRESLNKEYRRYSDPDFLLSVVIIPLEGELYGCCFDDDIDENRALIADIADDFSYQNQTDKPDYISEKEWELRSHVWNAIFDKYVTFADAGVTYEIVKAEDFPDKLIKEIFESFKKEFEMGWHIVAKLRDSDESAKKFKESSLLEKIGHSIYPYNIGVRDLCWLSAFPHFNVYIKEEDNKEIVLRELENHSDFIENIKVEFTHIKKHYLINKKET